MKNTLNIDSFNRYVKSENFSKYQYKGFYTHENYIFLVCIDNSLSKQFKNKVLNRRAEIITESEKIVNNHKKTLRNYFLIDTKQDNNIKLSIKALFKKFNLLYRPIYYVKVNENKSRN